SSPLLLRLGQLAGQDRDEDDVVDPQHDFERREGQQRDPDLRIGERFKHRRSEGRGSRGRAGALTATPDPGPATALRLTAATGGGRVPLRLEPGAPPDTVG